MLALKFKSINEGNKRKSGIKKDNIFFIKLVNLLLLKEDLVFIDVIWVIFHVNE